MFNYKSLLFLLLLLFPLLAKKATSLEGVWITQSINEEKIDDGVVVFSKDTIISYNNSREDTRTSYSLLSETIVIDQDTGAFRFNGDTLTLVNDDNVVVLTPFKEKQLPRPSRKLIKKLKGDWFLVGYLHQDSLQGAEKDTRNRITFSSIIVSVFENDSLQQSNSFRVEDDHLFIETAKVAPQFKGDTLILTATEDQRSLILIPFSQAPPLDTAFIANKKSCKNAVEITGHLLNNAMVYEAEHGEFATTIDSLWSYIKIPEESDWTFSYTAEKDVVTVRATVKEGAQIGTIKGGDYFELNSKSKARFTHPDFQEVYGLLRYYDAQLVE